MRAPLALAVLILAFVVAFILFVQSPAPYGVIDFSPPTGNFTGTTTITTTYGYVCAASLVSGAQGDVNGTLTTLTGIGMNCHPELYGSLQVPVGPEIFVVWLIAFAIGLGSLAFYLYRKPLKGRLLLQAQHPLDRNHKRDCEISNGGQGHLSGTGDVGRCAPPGKSLELRRSLMVRFGRPLSPAPLWTHQQS
jgi:hypothetical protein